MHLFDKVVLREAPPPNSAPSRDGREPRRLALVLALALAVALGGLGAQYAYDHNPAGAIQSAQAFVVQSMRSLQGFEISPVLRKFQIMPKGAQDKLRQRWKGVTG